MSAKKVDVTLAIIAIILSPLILYGVIAIVNPLLALDIYLWLTR